MVIVGMSLSVGSGPVVSAGVTPAFSARVTGIIDDVEVGWWGEVHSDMEWGCCCNNMCMQRDEEREQPGRVSPPPAFAAPHVRV